MGAIISSGGGKKKMNPTYREPSVKRKCAVHCFEWIYGGDEVFITGTFCNWELIEMEWDRERKSWIVCLEIEADEHFWRFIVDGEYKFNPRTPFVKEDDGHFSNRRVFSPGKVLSVESLHEISEEKMQEVMSVASSVRKPRPRSNCSIASIPNLNSGEFSQEEYVFDNVKPRELPTLMSVNPILSNMLGFTQLPISQHDPHLHVTLNHAYLIHHVEDKEPYSKLYQFGISKKHQGKMVTYQFFTPKNGG